MVVRGGVVCGGRAGARATRAWCCVTAAPASTAGSPSCPSTSAPARAPSSSSARPRPRRSCRSASSPRATCAPPCPPAKDGAGDRREWAHGCWAATMRSRLLATDGEGARDGRARGGGRRGRALGAAVGDDGGAVVVGARRGGLLELELVLLVVLADRERERPQAQHGVDHVGAVRLVGEVALEDAHRLVDPVLPVVHLRAMQRLGESRDDRHGGGGPATGGGGLLLLPAGWLWWWWWW